MSAVSVDTEWVWIARLGRVSLACREGRHETCWGVAAAIGKDGQPTRGMRCACRDGTHRRGHKGPSPVVAAHQAALIGPPDQRTYFRQRIGLTPNPPAVKR